MKKFMFIAYTALISLGSCKKAEIDIPKQQEPEQISQTPDDFSNLKPSEGMGYITGTVVSGNGNYKINQANAYVDVNGHIYMTKSNKNGNFALEAPAGNHQLFITTGDGQKFRTVLDVTVNDGQNKPVSGSNIQLRQVSNLAFVYGEYDDIQTIVRDSLGYSIDQLFLADLSNLNKLKTYDAIFLNCGHGYNDLNTPEYSAIKQYVAGGGDLYASDWAIGYLTGNDDGDFMISPNQDHHAAPRIDNGTRSCTPRLGGFIPASVLCSDKSGNSGYYSSNDIVASDIQALLGKTNIDLEYDLGSWEVIEQLGTEFDVLVQDNNFGYGPLAIRSNQSLLTMLGGGSGSGGNGGGNSNFVTICHIPPGNPGNPQTITISSNALSAHIAHGDQVGPCDGDGGIIYTTFHNHPSGHTSEDVKDILEYFILNL